MNSYTLIVQCICELEEKKWLFPYEQLEIGEELGSGAFGIVRKAVAHDVRGSSITVAVKMLKGTCSYTTSHTHAPTPIFSSFLMPPHL